MGQFESFIGVDFWTALFVLLLVITVVVVGALTFLPALALGPVVEHLQMLAGR